MNCFGFRVGHLDRGRRFIPNPQCRAESGLETGVKLLLLTEASQFNFKLKQKEGRTLTYRRRENSRPSPPMLAIPIHCVMPRYKAAYGIKTQGPATSG